MKQWIILILALLALTVTVDAGLAFDNRQGNAGKNSNNPPKSGNKISCTVESSLNKAGKALEKAGKRTGQALGVAADKTTRALERAGKHIQGWFDESADSSK
jgi:hypothetical protein